MTVFFHTAPNTPNRSLVTRVSPLRQQDKVKTTATSVLPRPPHAGKELWAVPIGAPLAPQRCSLRIRLPSLFYRVLESEIQRGKQHEQQRLPTKPSNRPVGYYLSMLISLLGISWDTGGCLELLASKTRSMAQIYSKNKNPGFYPPKPSK